MSPSVRARGDVILEHTPGFTLEPRETALVVVDMQYATACRTAGLGRWLKEQDREAEGQYRFDRIEETLIPHIARMLEFFREYDLYRIFVRLGAQLHGCRDLLPQLQELEAAVGNIAGNREYEILGELAPLEGEPVITKLSASAFTSSGFDALLRNLGARSLILVGVSTSQCVDLTARDAADRGYQTLIVEDAVAEDRPDYHAWTLEQFRRLFGRVATTDEVIVELDARRGQGGR